MLEGFDVQLFADRYLIEAEIGQGGFGRVFRAQHVGLGRTVALKVLASDQVGNDVHVRLAREARSVALLDHPGCVRVFDHGRHHDGTAYLAMELLDGPTLADAMDDGAVAGERHALEIVRQILDALAHAHRAGVVHRDVKPGNVMLARRPHGPRAVLIDFGLARLRDDAVVTAAGLCVGSPSYVAPERLLGRPASPRSDLYAVGVMLYELIAGVRPFRGESPEAIARAHLLEEPQPLDEVVPVSATTAAVVRRALAKPPGQRFGTAEEILAALPRCVSDAAAYRVPIRAFEHETTAIQLRTVDGTDGEGPIRSRLRRLWSRLWFGAWRWRYLAPLRQDMRS